MSCRSILRMCRDRESHIREREEFTVCTVSAKSNILCYSIWCERESLRPRTPPASQAPFPSCSISRLARRAGPPPRCAHTAHELPVCGGAHPPPTRLSHPDCLYPQVHGTCGLLYIRACVRARAWLSGPRISIMCASRETPGCDLRRNGGSSPPETVSAGGHVVRPLAQASGGGTWRDSRGPSRRGSIAGRRRRCARRAAASLASASRGPPSRARRE